MWALVVFRSFVIALCLFQLYSYVQAFPQATFARLHQDGTLGQQLSPFARGPVISNSKGNVLPHISGRHRRPFCNMNLDDAQVCPSGQACVEDPWQPELFTSHESNQRNTRTGVCTPTTVENMCGGFAGPVRRCRNADNGWQCAKPSRCEKESISDCDWLCVMPPPSSVAGGRGLGFDFGA